MMRVKKSAIEVGNEVSKFGRVFAALVHGFVQGLEKELFKDGVVIPAFLFHGF